MHKEGAVGILFFAMSCLVEGQVIWEARAQGEYGVPPGPLGGDTHLERAEHERNVPVAHASTQSARGWIWTVGAGLVNMVVAMDGIATVIVVIMIQWQLSSTKINIILNLTLTDC